MLLNKNCFLFGFPDGTQYIFNLVILYAKHSIFSAKYLRERLSLDYFKKMLKRCYEVERVLSIKRNIFVVLPDKWRHVLFVLPICPNMYFVQMYCFVVPQE